jgi:hypothetical protein
VRGLKNISAIFGEKIVSATLLFLSGGGLFFHGKGNVSDADFWFDESGQYWISQGQYHFSPFGTPVQPFSIEHAANWNLDPPGFSLLLRGWIHLFGDSTEALRLLPFVFLMGFLLVTGLIARQFLGVPFAFGIASSLIIVVVSIGEQYATELRAYSAELFFVAFSCWALLRWSRKKRSFNLAVLVFAMSLGLLASRYSFVFAAVAVSGFVLKTSSQVATLRQSLQTLVFFCVAMALAGYLFWFAVELPSSGPQSAPGYVDEILLSNLSSVTELGPILQKNFLSYQTLPMTIFIALWPFLARDWKNRGEITGARNVEQESVHVLWSFVLLYTASAALASIAGIYPWLAEARWSIGFVASAAFSLIGLLAIIRQPKFAELLETIPLIRTRMKRSFFRNTQRVVVLGLFLSTLYSSWAFGNYRHQIYEPLTSGVGGYLELRRFFSEQRVEGTGWLIESRLWPSFRMAIERNVSGEHELAHVATMPDFEFQDESRAMFLEENISCPVSGRNFYLTRFPITRGSATDKLLRSFSEKSDCIVIQYSDFDVASLISVESR